MEKIKIEEIFNLTGSDLKNKLLEYEDETKYSNNLERINAVIIHSFNNELLNPKEMKIVESDNYDNVMKSNPKSYSDFLNLLKVKKKINININPQLLKSWNNPKVTTLEGHTDTVSSVAVSDIINTADGFRKQYIISGSHDKTIKIWDLSTFELVETLKGHTHYVMSVAVSSVKNTATLPNNIEKQYIISGSIDYTIKIWDMSTFELVETLEGHTSRVNSVVVISSIEKATNLPKQYIISGSMDDTIKIWDMSTFKLIKTLEGHTDSVNSVAVISSIEKATNLPKHYIISGSADKTIKIWDFSTFKLVETLEGHTTSVWSVAVSDKYIISGSADTTIKIWDLSTFELVETLEGHIDIVNCVVVSGIINTTDEFGNIISKQYIISGSDDETIKIWDISTFKLVKTLKKHTGAVLSVAVSSIINTTDKFANIISSVENTATLPDNIGKQYIISGSGDETIKIWDLSTFELIKTLEGHRDYVNCVAVSSVFNTTDY